MEGMSDAFWHSEDLVEETVNSDTSAIDPARPGFSSLLPLLREELKGRSQPGVLAAYHAGLSAQLAHTRTLLDTLPMSDELRTQAAPALQATADMFNRMDEVLALIADHLETASTETLEAATQRLSDLHTVMLSLASPR